jgi:hypothetical protein
MPEFGKPKTQEKLWLRKLQNPKQKNPLPRKLPRKRRSSPYSNRLS